ncbi:MAG: serine protease [bacterium]|nr:serine protease [bacterium]
MKNMRNMRKILYIAVLITVFSTVLHSEVIQLKEGAVIKGSILKKTKKHVIVDLGFDVIKVPVSDILKIKKNDNKIKEPENAQQDNNNLYSEKTHEIISTEEGVQTFAPSVVVVRSPGGMGSGFFINKDGYVITNFHVIKGEKHLTITRFKKFGKELKRIVHKKIRIVALDPFHDLAVLQIEEKISDGLQPVVLSPADDVEMGEKIFVIGNPLGLERTVTEGVISHTSRIFAGKIFLQVDASVNPGNSGGPLFNSRGQIIGVINMGVRNMQGLNFAIPVRHVKFLLDHIDAFAYSETNSQTGYVYPLPPPNPQKFKNKKTGK